METATYSSILAWEIPEDPDNYNPQGRKELDMTQETEHTHLHTETKQGNHGVTQESFSSLKHTGLTTISESTW